MQAALLPILLLDGHGGNMHQWCLPPSCCAARLCDFKCMFCCSIALFVSEGGKKFDCEPCIHNALEGSRKVMSACTGGPGCQLGVWSHPKADPDVKKSKFALGCGLCRSEKLSVIVRPSSHHKNPTGGINLETREDMKNKHGHFKGHNINYEMKIVKGQGN